MAKWIYNDSGSQKTWVGQVINNGAYYQIQPQEEKTWAHDDTLMTAIGDEDAIVSTTNASSGHLGINDGINHLKDIDTGATEIAGVRDPKGMRARLIGALSGTATANTTTNIDWKIPQLTWQSANKNSYFDGIEYYTTGIVGDSCKFQVVDVDNILGAGAGYVVEEFGTDYWMWPNTAWRIQLYKAQLIKDLYVRMVYNNTHASNNCSVYANLYRHLDGNS